MGIILFRIVHWRGMVFLLAWEHCYKISELCHLTRHVWALLAIFHLHHAFAYINDSFSFLYSSLLNRFSFISSFINTGSIFSSSSPTSGALPSKFWKCLYQFSIHNTLVLRLCTIIGFMLLVTTVVATSTAWLYVIVSLSYIVCLHCDYRAWYTRVWCCIYRCIRQIYASLFTLRLVSGCNPELQH